MFSLYLARYQHMDKKNFVSFEDFKKTNMRRKQLYSTTKTDEEIIAEVLEIKKKFEPEEGENLNGTV